MLTLCCNHSVINDRRISKLQRIKARYPLPASAGRSWRHGAKHRTFQVAAVSPHTPQAAKGMQRFYSVDCHQAGCTACLLACHLAYPEWAKRWKAPYSRRRIGYDIACCAPAGNFVAIIAAQYTFCHASVSTNKNSRAAYCLFSSARVT